MERILIVDDDQELCELVTEYLGREGFHIEVVHTGKVGLERAASREHALVVLDVMLPELNGFDVLRQLRTTTSVPVLMLTARGDDVDRIVGLEIGADDYLPKPFNPRELAARIRAILRRATHARTTNLTPLRVGDIELDLGTRSVRQAGAEVTLTTVEFEVLRVLLERAGEIVTRDSLSLDALGRPFNPLDRSIDMHVSNLRRKLHRAVNGDDLIKTIRGEGYQFVLPRP